MKYDIPGHYLRRNHSKQYPDDFIVYDTETDHISVEDGELLRMRLAWSVHALWEAPQGIVSETWLFHSSPHHLCRYIASCARRDHAIYVIAHNVFFDMQASDVFFHFTRWGWERDFIYNKGTTYIFIIRKGRYVIKWISLSNFYPVSLRELGAAIGRHKGDPDFENVEEGTLSCYCFRDVEIALDTFDGYLSTLSTRDLGSFGLSRASQAYRAYRHRFMHHKLYVHSDDAIRELEHSAYFGGRSEAFQLGKIRDGPIVTLDINGMYPFVMRSKPMPIKAEDYFISPSIEELSSALRFGGVIADVELSTDRPLYPYRHKGKVLFPIGRFRTVLATEGVRRALEAGEITRCHRMVCYDMAVIFRSYVDFFQSMRDEAREGKDPITASVAKLMLNSLYGKFAQKRPVTTVDETITEYGYSRESVYDLDRGVYVTETKLMNRLTLTEGEEPCPGSIVAIPAHVTEYARMLLWDIMEEIGLDRVLYVDTDGIKIRQCDLPRVIHPIDSSALGSLKLERSDPWIVIYGVKDYRAPGLIKMKGIPQSAEKIGKGKYRYLLFVRQNGHLAAHIDRHYKLQSVTKTLSRVYDKGKVNRRGKVIPFSLPSDASLLR